MLKSILKITYISICSLLLFTNSLFGEINLPKVEELPADSLLAKILKKGEIIVGVKADYPPWGQYNQEGTELIGLEVDLAKDLSKRMGVNLRLVPVNSRNRLTKLEDGSVNLVIATMGDTAKRRDQSGLILPNYYSSGVTLLASKDSLFTDWNQLKGRSVCLTSGAYFNQTLMDRFLIKPIVFEGTRDTGLGLKSGQCVGWAYDNTSLEQRVNSGDWENYGFKLPVILSTPWALAVPKDERKSGLGFYVSNVVEEWLRTGYILDLQEIWGLPKSEYLYEQKEIFSRKAEDGDTFFCKKDIDGYYPSGCQSQQIIQSSGVFANKSKLILDVEKITGLDFAAFYNESVRERLKLGALLTITVSFSSIVGAVLLSMLFVVLAGSNNILLRWPFRFLIMVFRSSPPLIVLYICFFGIGAYVYKTYGLSVSSISAAVLVFSLYAGSGIAGVLLPTFVSERRSGYDQSKGMFSSIAKAYRSNLDAVVANSVNIVKATGMASAIALPELITTSNSVIADWGNSSTMMNVLLLSYFLYVLIVMFILKSIVRLVT